MLWKIYVQQDTTRQILIKKCASSICLSQLIVSYLWSNLFLSVTVEGSGTNLVSLDILEVSRNLSIQSALSII